MRFPRKVTFSLVGALILGAVGVAWATQKMQLPKPQGTFQEGQSAPDFSLKDQDGNVFHLADSRGTGTLLIFYRGYW
jgi:cytochrome oxidase Cu insertion factor (SCO1/SenC/PrrC family)